MLASLKTGRALSIAALLCLAWPAAAQVLDVQQPPQELRIEAPAFDRAGIDRDTAYFLGYQLAGAGLIVVGSKVGGGHREVNFDRWLHNVTHPQWDTDDVVVNYVLHPYWGAAYYIRGRERGLNKPQAFWYSVLLSSMFEYTAEALVEQVSYQDLVSTPVLGALLGEYVFAPTREHILAKPGPLSTMDRVALVLTDPLDAINSAVDRLFGLEAEVSIGPMLPGDSWSRRSFATSSAHLPQLPKGPHAGHRAGWSLRIRMSW